MASKNATSEREAIIAKVKACLNLGKDGSGRGEEPAREPEQLGHGG